MEQTIPRLIRATANKYPKIPSQYSRNKDGSFTPVTYSEMFAAAENFAAGLLSIGTKREEKIGLISDNRKEWEQADIGLLSIGAIDVPRGGDATVTDLKYILSFTECRTVIAENSTQVKKIIGIKNDLPCLKTLITFDDAKEEEIESAKKTGVNVVKFVEILEEGKSYLEKNPNVISEEIDKGNWDDIAGIIFTSGTTGTPKGVMLSHGNFITQLDELNERIYLFPGDKALCVLPVWHVFQRLCEYVILNQGAALCYSKPIASILLPDFATLNPQLLPAVPRVLEAIYEGVNKTMRRTGGIVNILYNFFVAVAILHSRIDRKLFRKNIRFGNDHIVLWWPVLVLPWLALYPLKLLGGVLVFKKVRAKLGNAFRAGVAGGGAYPSAIDEYFWALGINVVEGYGMTETAPVVAVRPIKAPIFGCIGTPIRGVSVRVVDMEGNVLPKCKKGVLQVKGGTVMKGYYKREDLTNKVLSADGWLDTGDLAIIGVDGEIKLLGRVKDTIVLRGGENIEPLPLESKIQESQYITAAVVVGQDQRDLGALILPNKEEIELYAKTNNVSYKDYDDLLKSSEIKKLVESILREEISGKNGFKMYERVTRFAFITKPFEIGKELSAKQEIMRYRIAEIYEKEIKLMFKN